MRDFNKIIDSLVIRLRQVGHLQVLQPLTLANFFEVEQTLILLHQGQMSYTHAGKAHNMGPGTLLFIPGGQAPALTWHGPAAKVLSKEALAEHPEQYFEPLSAPGWEAPFANYSYVTFEAQALQALNLFTALGIPPFIIQDNPYLHHLCTSILLESSTQSIGSHKMVQVNTEQLVITLIRHLLDQRLFPTQLARHHHYLQDPRLLRIVTYIQGHLEGELSNRMLGEVADVSEEYAGQYFKVRTGNKLQDYIEHQRMERAAQLLRYTNDPIRDIARAVGFRDTAYFCRRLKGRLGLPATKLRKNRATLGPMLPID